MAGFDYQVTNFAYQGSGQFVYQGEGGVVPGPTVFYQGDGKKRRKRLTRDRHVVYDLFKSIEDTIRERVIGVEPSVPSQLTIGGTRAVQVTVSHGLDRALDELTLLATEQRDLSARVAQIRREVVAYEARRRQALDDDDDEVFMVMG